MGPVVIVIFTVSAGAHLCVCAFVCACGVAWSFGCILVCLFAGVFSHFFCVFCVVGWWS